MQSATIQFDDSGEASDLERENILSALRSINYSRFCSDAVRVSIRVGPKFDTLSTPTDVHRTWRATALACLPALEGVPALNLKITFGLPVTLVEVSLIARYSGGMSSYYGFAGFFLSCVFDRTLSILLDVRGEIAS